MPDFLTELEKLDVEATPGPFGYISSDLGVIIQQGPFADNDHGNQSGVDWVADAKIGDDGNDAAITFKTYADLHMWMLLRNKSREIAELVKAAKSLSNEVSGMMTISEDAIRQDAGNTNYQCVVERLNQTKEALNALNAPNK